MGCEFSTLDMNEGSPGKHTTDRDNDVLIVSNVGYINLILRKVRVSSCLLFTHAVAGFFFFFFYRRQWQNIPELPWKRDQEDEEEELASKAFYNTTYYKVTKSYDPDMSSAPWCVCVQSHLLLITSFLSPLSGGSAVWGPECLSECRVPAGILSPWLLFLQQL